MANASPVTGLPTCFTWSAAFVLLVTTSCQALTNGQEPHPTNAGTELLTDAGRQPALACTGEEDCASLGPGHMCMNGGCMLMEVNAPRVVAPAPSAQDTSPPLLADENPAADVFEAHLFAVEDDVEIVPGQTTHHALVYKPSPNDVARVPGPLIDVALGTRLVIHFENRTSQATSIHWHGLVLPFAMDGAPLPAGEVPPGGSFTFDFTPRDGALYWYHPHFHGDVQIERGLYGLLRVRGADEPTVDTERVIALDDVFLDDDAQIVPPAEGSVMTPDGKMTFEGMMGRQGNHLLFNGRMNPILDVVPGTVERWRIVNTANARFFRLAVPGHTFVVVGTDGGLVPAPHELNDLLIAPGERYDVLIAMTGDPSVDVPLLTKHHDRGHDMADPGDLVVATLRYGAIPTATMTSMPQVSHPIALLDVTGASTQRLVMGESVLRGGKVGFTFDEQRWPDVTTRQSHLGGVEVWEIANETHMDHPFHLHGFPFQVLSRQAKDGPVVDEPFHSWKDTVIVPPETRLRFAVKYDGFPGMWMFHCHILEHAERGMMGMIDVMP